MSEIVILPQGTGGHPRQLAEHLPMRASTLKCLPSAHGQGEFWCARLDQPVKYRLDEAFDHQRCQPEFLATDGAGEFLWITVVVVWASSPDDRLHPGMRGLDVEVAYVIDQTLGLDTVFDPAKVDIVGAAVVDDARDTPTSTSSPDVHAGSSGGAQATKGELDVPSHTPVLRDAGAFDDELNRMVATLAALTGLHPGSDLPRRTTGPAPETPERALYEIGPDTLRYFRFDPTAGWQWSIPKDLDDLLYQVVNDTAGELAWRWSEKAPAAHAGESARQDIATDFWRVLMTALAWRTGSGTESD